MKAFAHIINRTINPSWKFMVPPLCAKEFGRIEEAYLVPMCRLPLGIAGNVYIKLFDILFAILNKPFSR